MTLDGGMPGPRPLRADARRNRQRVLDAAEAAFAREGIAVPLDEIARRAGVGAGTVYRHFPTKEALFHAIVLSHHERMTERARALAGAQNPGEAFFGFLAVLVEEGRAKRYIVDALPVGRLDPSPATIVVGQEFRSAVADLLARGQDAGAVRGDVRVEEIMALLRGISQAVRDAGDPDLPMRLVEVVCDGLRSEARR